MDGPLANGGTSMHLTRRAFLLAASAAAAAARLGAQGPGGTQGTPGVPAGADAAQGAANVPMNETAYRPVKRPAKANAEPVVSKAERDDLEHRIACQCGCTLDIYTCRTTDFSCGVSPAMHSDVVALVEGGYSAQEIIDAFSETYGERVLMAPTKQGFNLVGWVMPFAALGGGSVIAALLLLRWRRAARVAAAQAPAPVIVPADATVDELARIDAAVRENA
jgi:cytochrome c-type biogenesis protein CcmH